MVPVTKECPYVEALFDPSSGVLAVITKTIKGSYHMVPKLDDNGDPQRLKLAKRENGKTIKEQRSMVDTFSEFYMNNLEEIKNFIKMFAINADKFNYKEFLEPKQEENSPTITLESVT